MSYNKSANTHIRSLYSVGFSSLTISFFKTNLTLSFVPYTGKDYRGFSQYSKTMFLSTAVNYEGASFLCMAAMSILAGKENQIEAVLPYLNNATLIFEYKPDENNQMRAYLSINKNNETIPFKFLTHEYKVTESGQTVTKIIQSGLGTFAKTLEGYLTGVNADGHLNKLPDDFENTQNENQQF